MKVVYDRVIDLAKEKNLSLIKLSEQLDLGKNTIGDWKTKSPKAEKVIQVANFFQVSTDYLFGLTDDRRPSSPSVEPSSHLLKLIHYMKEQNFTVEQIEIIFTTIQDLQNYSQSDIT